MVLGVLLAVPVAGAQEYEAAAVENGGSIVGTITWTGGPVERHPLEITQDQETCAHEPILSEALVVDEASKGIRDVVVSITGITSGKPFERESRVRIEQQGCRFLPHVVLAPMESIVEVTNEDPVAHNVTAVAFDNDSMNKLQPAKGTVVEYEVWEFERIPLKCEIHPWMSATLVVMEHPYYTVTAGDGTFRMDDVPPGTWTLSLWHETLGEAAVTVTVEPGQEASVTHGWSAEE